MIRNDDATLALRQLGMARALSSAGTSWPDELLGNIVPGGTLDAAGALEVYRNGYFARLTEQLGETYRTVWRAVGDESFFALCASFIAAHPSASYNLSDYGRELAGFLETHAETAEAPFLPDLARLELAYHDLFHARAHVPAAPAVLASIGDLSGVRFQIGTAVRLLALGHAVLELFHHRFDDDEAVAPSTDGIDRPQRLLLFRRQTAVVVEEIGVGAFAALHAMSGGETVESALERASAEDPDFSETDAADLFETIAVAGLASGWSR